MVEVAARSRWRDEKQEGHVIRCSAKQRERDEGGRATKSRIAGYTVKRRILFSKHTQLERIPDQETAGANGPKFKKEKSEMNMPGNERTGRNRRERRAPNARKKGRAAQKET